MTHGPMRHEVFAAAQALLPFMRRYCDEGWPGLGERDRTEATNALADLRALIEDQTPPHRLEECPLCSGLAPADVKPEEVPL